MDELEQQRTIDSTAIEKKAILCLEEYLVDSKVVRSNVKENDKEPSWDGHLYLFRSPAKDKNVQVGRVPVQVKGHEVSKIKIKKFSFPIEVADLRAYLHEPTVYIVCQEKINSKERLLFYRCLLPETIKHILKDKARQKTIRVHMNRMPDDVKSFEDILFTFKHDSIKQLSFSDRDPFTMKDAIDKKINKFSFIAPGHISDKIELMGYLSTHHTFLYAQFDKELQIEIPISDGPMEFKFHRDVKENIKVGNTVFFTEFSSDIEDGNLVIRAGNILSLTYDITHKKFIDSALNLNCPSHSLTDKIKEAELVLALNEQGSITIGDTTLQLGVKDQGLIAEVRTLLPSWKKLQQLLNLFHVTKEFDINGVTEEQGKLIDMLIKTIIDQEPVEIPGQESKVILMEISNVKLLVLLTANKEGKCMFSDFFSHKLSLRYKFSDTESVEASSFSYLQNDNLWQKCDNIPFSEQIPDYERLSSNGIPIFDVVNWDVLFMLKAYDAIEFEDSKRASVLIEQIRKVNEWLRKNDTDINRNTIHLINHYQIQIRLRQLADNEIQELSEILQEEDVSPFLKSGICLLLKDLSAYDHWLSKCSEEERKKIKAYPIYRFFQG